MKPDLEKQRRVADALITLGWARRLPLRHTRCTTTVELRSAESTASDANTRRLYVLPDGRVRTGYTLRESMPLLAGCQAKVDEQLLSKGTES